MGCVGLPWVGGVVALREKCCAASLSMHATNGPVGPVRIHVAFYDFAQCAVERAVPLKGDTRRMLRPPSSRHAATCGQFAIAYCDLGF